MAKPVQALKIRLRCRLERFIIDRFEDKCGDIIGKQPLGSSRSPYVSKKRTYPSGSSCIVVDHPLLIGAGGERREAEWP